MNNPTILLILLCLFLIGYVIYLKQNNKKEINREINDFSFDEKKAKAIILDSLEKAYSGFLKHPSTNLIKLKNQDIRSAIIGKSGRNLKLIEKLTQCDIVFDNNTDKIQISSFNPIKREVAVELIKQLIEAKSINARTIETQFDNALLKTDDILLRKGQEAFQTLDLKEINVEVTKTIGKLFLRHSYGQNVLSHSIETAKIMANLAIEFKLDQKKAMLAGLMHDIGKAIDIEKSGSHVDLGVKFAQKHNLPFEVIDAIAAHHNDVPAKSLTAALVAFADKISAARPGARKNVTEKLYVRIEKIEKIAKRHNEVKDSYVIRGGKELRVIIKPKTNMNLNDIALKIKADIEKEIKFPGSINIVLIKENRFSIEAIKEK